MLLTSARARSRADAGQCSGGFHGQEAGGYGLQDRRSRRRQREVVGGRVPKRRRNGSRFAARPARGRSDENGYEGGEREGRSISHARVAVLQIRSLIAASRISARRSPDGGLAARERRYHRHCGPGDRNGMTFLRIVIPSNLLLEHDLFRKPVPTFRDHALVVMAAESDAASP